MYITSAHRVFMAKQNILPFGRYDWDASKAFSPTGFDQAEFPELLTQ